MKLTLFNGSPRGEKSNTTIIMDKFLAGFAKTPGNSADVYYLNNKEKRRHAELHFEKAETVILAFPLYSDGMPGLVKEFIESLAPLKGREHNPKIGFVVQSGFPEGIHTATVGRYLEKLSRRLGCPYIGTVRKGGVEGIQQKPARMNRKLYAAFESLGKTFGSTGAFDPVIVNKLKKPERFPKFIFPIFFLMMKLGLIDMGWNMQLKANKAYDKRYDKPFA